MSPQGRPSGGTNRFFASYYVANGLLVASYGLIRLWHIRHNAGFYSRLQKPSDIIEKERHAVLLLCFLLALKFVRRISMDAFMSDFFFFTKSVACLMLWYIDLRLLVYFVLLIVAFFLMFPQPVYKGPAKLEYFTPASFKELVEERTSAESPRWIVEFYASWAPQCVYLEPVIADLSMKYSGTTLRWGKMDVGRWPMMAKEYNISVQGASSQLPTLILFNKGKEVGRIPHVFPDGRVAGGKFRKNDIIVAFDLENEQAGVKDKKAHSKQGGKQKKSS